MAVTTFGLLLGTIGLTLAAPRRIPRWLPPIAGATVAVAAGLINPSDAWEAIRPLVEPLAFLLLAVPLAMMLDRLGFFEACAGLFAEGHRLRPSLWVMGAIVTTVFNLDAAVVLLTPLFIRIARRHGFPPLQIAFFPALLASLASSALPVSNLTNLIAASALDLSTIDFLVHLGLPSLAAVVVGWLMMKRTLLKGTKPIYSHEPINSEALRIGTPVVLFLLIGFTVGEAYGIHAWVVVAVVDLYLTWKLWFRSNWHLADWHIPWDAAVLAIGLAVVAAAAASRGDLTSVLAADDPGSALRTVGVAAAGANLINNLPALLIGLDALPTEQPAAVWALLIGVNFGPVLLITGSLSGLLWMSTARRMGVDVRPLDYTLIGLRVGLPAMGAAVLVWLSLESLLGSF